MAEDIQDDRIMIFQNGTDSFSFNHEKKGAPKSIIL